MPDTAIIRKRGLIKMVDLKEKSREEIFREKKESELRGGDSGETAVGIYEKFHV